MPSYLVKVVTYAEARAMLSSLAYLFTVCQSGLDPGSAFSVLYSLNIALIIKIFHVFIELVACIPYLLMFCRSCSL